jgi:amicoumacin kinase
LEQRIRERFHGKILQEALGRYGIPEDHARVLDGFESFIYEYERDGEEFILRISHSLRRSENLIRGEVDWINYLSAGGVPAARAVFSKGGNLVEPVADGHGDYFLATSFVKAYGKHPWYERTPAFYQNYGRMLGSIHALTERYQPADWAWKRPEWDDNVMEVVECGLPENEEGVKRKYRELLEHLYALPKTPTCYGLIHQDPHAGNFLMDEAGRLTLFDFDDCVYSWYANDIAIALFYMAFEAPEGPAFVTDFLPHFLQGYREKYPVEDRWLKEIPYFLKEREIELYAIIYSVFGPNPVEDEWCLKYMQRRKERIESEVPFIPEEILLPALGL